jgi:RHS repeat-associated protein
VTRLIGTQTYISGYDHNDRGNLEKLTYPTETEVIYQRYDNERVSGVLIDGEVLSKDVTYLPFGPEEDHTFGDNALTVNRTFYDNYFRVERIDAGILNYHYTYYADGKVKTIDGIPPPGSSGGATEYSYPTGNRLDHSTGHETANHTYDNNGNITSDGTFTFVYNQNNRLSEVKIGNAAIARYAYDGFGRRVKKEIVASGVIVHYHYDLQSNLLAESGGDGTPLRDYIYQNGNLIAIKIYGDQAGIYYVIYDHPGTPQQIVNTSGTVVWKAAYLPFGQAQILVETITCNIRFPGQYYDSETGLHYNINRYYNPLTGRYMTPDPIGLEGGINLYPYVQNDPINSIDPEGLEGIGIQKPTTDNGTKQWHTHYGTETNPRRDGAVYRDGKLVHKGDKVPNKRQKKLIRRKYPNFFLKGVKGIQPIFILPFQIDYADFMKKGYPRNINYYYLDKNGKLVFKFEGACPNS